MMVRPKFIDSEWFVPETDNWHLKPGAPKSIVEEFRDYMERDKEAAEDGSIID